MLGVLGQATLNFVAVATLLFFFFCECPKFCDLAKQRCKIFSGVSEVEKIDFALFFFWLCVFFLVFFSSAAIARGSRIGDASDVGGGGTIYQWQELNPAELTHCHYRTNGLNRDGSLKHDYPTSEWRLVPLGHWNWKWNQARSNYSTYDQELLAGMLVLSSQSRLLRSNPIVWLCDQEPVKSF